MAEHLYAAGAAPAGPGEPAAGPAGGDPGGPAHNGGSTGKSEDVIDVEFEEKK